MNNPIYQFSNVVELEEELFKMGIHELEIVGKLIENEIARRAIYDRKWSERLK